MVNRKAGKSREGGELADDQCFYHLQAAVFLLFPFFVYRPVYHVSHMQQASRRSHSHCHRRRWHPQVKKRRRAERTTQCCAVSTCTRSTPTVFPGPSAERTKLYEETCNLEKASNSSRSAACSGVRANHRPSTSAGNSHHVHTNTSLSVLPLVLPRYYGKKSDFIFGAGAFIHEFLWLLWYSFVR